MTKKIVNFCPTGTQTTPSNSKAPLSATKIIEEVHQAFEENLITLVHVHAREQEKNLWSAKDYEPIVTGIRAHCPGLAICISLSGRLFPQKEQRADALSLYPDMGSLTLSSLNFKSGSSTNAPDMIYYLMEQMAKYNVKPELECFDAGMVHFANHLIADYALKPPFYFNVILGNLYNAQPDPITIGHILNTLPKSDSYVCLGGIGRHQLKSNLMGLLYANGARIGLEDNLYLNESRELATNYQLLQQLNQVIKTLGMQVMAPSEFKHKGFTNSNHDKKG